MRICIECKKNVVSHYRAYFCEDCIKNFFGGGKKVEQRHSQFNRLRANRMAKGSHSRGIEG